MYAESRVAFSQEPCDEINIVRRIRSVLIIPVKLTYKLRNGSYFVYVRYFDLSV